MPYSCIIPVFNEQARVGEVLKQVSQVKNLAEIICVDDGSSDNSARVIKENFPKIKLIQHERNLGKTAAVVTGLSLATGETVLLLDSDLINLKSGEIDKALACFEQNGLDCLLLNTAPTNLAERLLRPVLRFLLLAAGSRVIHKQCLKEALQAGNFKSYDLEIAQNKYLMENRKVVGYFDISAIDVSKVSKNGLIKGTWQELVMWRQITSYAGLLFFIKQSLFFARRKYCR